MTLTFRRGANILGLDSSIPGVFRAMIQSIDPSA
jgi:hypothetical protein